MYHTRNNFLIKIPVPCFQRQSFYFISYNWDSWGCIFSVWAIGHVDCCSSYNYILYNYKKISLIKWQGLFFIGFEWLTDITVRLFTDDAVCDAHRLRYSILLPCVPRNSILSWLPSMTLCFHRSLLSCSRKLPLVPNHGASYQLGFCALASWFYKLFTEVNDFIYPA